MFPPRDPPKEPIVALHYPPQPVTYTATINGMLAIEAAPTEPESEQQPTEQQNNDQHQHVHYPRRMISVAPPAPGKSILNCLSSGSPAGSPGYHESTPNGSQERPATPSGSPFQSNPAFTPTAHASPTSVNNIDKDPQAAGTAATDAAETPVDSTTTTKAGLQITTFRVSVT